jgi:hypothetical protein
MCSAQGQISRRTSTSRRLAARPPETLLSNERTRASSRRSMVSRSQPIKPRASLAPTSRPCTARSPVTSSTCTHHFTVSTRAPRTLATTPAQTSTRRSAISGVWPHAHRGGMAPAPQPFTTHSRDNSSGLRQAAKRSPRQPLWKTAAPRSSRASASQRVLPFSKRSSPRLSPGQRPPARRRSQRPSVVGLAATGQIFRYGCPDRGLRLAA